MCHFTCGMACPCTRGLPHAPWLAASNKSGGVHGLVLDFLLLLLERLLGELVEELAGHVELNAFRQRAFLHALAHELVLHLDGFGLIEDNQITKCREKCVRVSVSGRVGLAWTDGET